MSIKEVIERLQAFQKEYGDDIIVVDTNYDPIFAIEDILYETNKTEEETVIMVS
jgi:hypothetical protein